MADHSSPKPDPAVPPQSGPPQPEPPLASLPPEDDLQDWREDDGYGDAEHARRLAAVRTELLRRTQPERTSEE
ncbi:MAG: hypothetical protein JNM62_10490 [Flavobacteriales bacterium]|nr:hypothetical protein [Flavobacteriales bacterium]